MVRLGTKAWQSGIHIPDDSIEATVQGVEVARTNPEPSFSKSIRANPMKGGARRKVMSSDPSPPPPPRRIRNEVNDQSNDHENQKLEQEQQQPMNDGEDAGNEYDQDEDEDYEEDEQSGDVDVDGGENEVAEERPKLAEGFYEIEAVRKRRIRKGETQYLIKWQGWPESANTWEPVVNLMACADVIDAFEERLKSGKHRSNRKRKRKHPVAASPQSKKKQKQHRPEDSPDATYPIPSTRIKIIEEPCEGHCIHKPNFSNVTENDVGGTSQNGATNQSNETGSLTDSPQVGENKERNESYVNRYDLKATSSSNQENMTEFAIHIQEDQVAEGAIPVETNPVNGASKVEELEVLRANPRIGARRRKSCAVKRFKQESNSDSKNNIAETTAVSDEIVQADIHNVGNIGNGLDSKSTIDTPQNVSFITKIVKPVNYSTSTHNGTEEVCVSFLVRRSDGEEVVVDNKYLKENNPILLINFYEQHLRYNSPE